ncbi:eukaryotic translation initiation factor 3 subunit J [Paraphysoderma sedebokerense]|nr:eukaryotic translation initiation factor 3 subunit J [Paraphysoderma sedebokerense]
MSDWEDYAEDDFAAPPVAPAPVKSRWDDEDVEEVKDSWEDELSEDESKANDTTTTSKTTPPKTKRSIKHAIEERQRQEELKKKELAAKKAAAEAARLKEEEETKGMSEFEKKKRLQKMVEQSDLKNVEDLFGGMAVKVLDTTGEYPLHTLTPKSKDDFDQYADHLVTRFKDFSSNPLYVAFLETLFRNLSDPLRHDDVKKLSSTLTTLSNEKLRAEKEASKKGKKNAKKQVVVRTEEFDDYAFGEGGRYEGEYDDFM